MKTEKDKGEANDDEIMRDAKSAVEKGDRNEKEDIIGEPKLEENVTSCETQGKVDAESFDVVSERSGRCEGGRQRHAAGGAAQTAHMICGAFKTVLVGKEVEINIPMFKSHKMTRAGSATLVGEASFVTEGPAEVESVASWIAPAKDATCDLRARGLRTRELEMTLIMSESYQILL